VCPETGEPLVKIGEEVTSKLAHKPASFFIKQIVRPKYALPQKSEGGVLTADLPESLLTRCQADESLLADILVKKFGDHLPLYRQSEIMAREGVNISRQILCQWVLRAGVALKPLYDEMLVHVLQSGNIFYDETPIDMLAPGKGKTHQAYMWVLVRYLFMLEKVAWARSEDERLRIRQEKEIPIIDRLIGAVKDKLVNGKILPKSKFKEALGYFCGLIPHLKNYAQHAWARLDNNVAERAVRPLAIGRKNWLFVGNEAGGEAAATILTLVQSCRALGVNPREYLEDVMRRLMSHNSKKLYELLPDQWLRARQ
jgi:transposase